MKQLVTHSRQATFFPPARPQPIRDAILAYLTEPRLAVDIARHIKRPVPTTTGHLAAMRRLGLVDRVGHGVYTLHGTAAAVGDQAFQPRKLPPVGQPEGRVAFLALARRIRRELAAPCRCADLAVRLGEPREMVHAAVERLWLSGTVTGNEKTGYKLVVRGERRRAIFARLLAALSEPQSAVRLADHLDISVAVARRRLSQLRDAGAVSVGEDGKFVRVNSSTHRPPVSDDMSRGSFAKTPDRVSA